MDYKKIVLNDNLMKNRLLVIIEKNLICPICGTKGLINGEAYICQDCNKIVLSEDEVIEDIDKYAKEEDYKEAYNDIKLIEKYCH